MPASTTAARFRRVALVGRYASPGIAEPLARLAAFVAGRGHAVVIDAESTQRRRFPAIRPRRGNNWAMPPMSRSSSAATARCCPSPAQLASFDVPLIGVNQGRLGFLTDIPLARMEAILGRDSRRARVEERRTLLEAIVQRAGQATDETVLALNEVVVNRGTSGGMIDTAVDIDGRFVYAMRSDGLIVATPTGSTAYALSAQGPIVEPQVPAFLLVPVAPHALTNRPIAVGDSATITVTLLRGNDAWAHCDGQTHFQLEEGDASRSAARGIRCACCIPRATTTSRCCAKSCTGAKRPSGSALGRSAQALLRLLSIRNFVVVDALDLELDGGFSVLTGETGAGKSILLDALGLLLGDRFEPRQLKPGAERAELAAKFDIDGHAVIAAWLAEQGLAADGSTLLLRRTQDAQGKSRAWINGRPATLAQLKEAGEVLVDLHGQHAHQSLVTADAQRTLVDAFGGFTTLARETAAAWRAWRAAIERRDQAAAAQEATAAERESLAARQKELSALDVSAAEWASLAQAQSRLAHAAALPERRRGRRRRADRSGQRARAPVVVAHRAARRGRRPRPRAEATSSRCSSRRASRWSRPHGSCAAIARSSISIRPSSPASRSGRRRFTTPRANTACGPKRSRTSWRRRTRSSRRSPQAADGDALAKRAAAAEASWRRSPASSRRNADSPRTSSKAASRRRCRSSR